VSKVEELKSRRDTQLTRLEAVIQELIAVISSDVTPFVQREMRRIFVAAGAYAETLDDDAVKRIKSTLVERAGGLQRELADKLSSTALWAGDDVPTAEGKTLEPNTAVWDVLQGLATSTATIARDLGFTEPEDGWDIVYRTPTWFIEGAYAPGLIEKYWTQLSLLRELDAEIGEAEAVERAERLAARWDTL